MGHLGREKKKGERKEEKEERRRKKKEEKKEKREEERKKKKKHLRSLRPRWPRPRRAEAPSSAEHAGLFFFLLHHLRQGIFSDQGAFTSPRVANSTSSHHHGCEKHITPHTQKNKKSIGGPFRPQTFHFSVCGGGWLRPCEGGVRYVFLGLKHSYVFWLPSSHS